MMKKSWGKRLLSGITSALLTISYVIPSTPIINSGAAESVSNLSGTAQTDDVTLLVGENNPLRGETVAQTIKNADSIYALGIASQFCVFLGGDFTPYDSDAEGRMAVGGSINADKTQWDEYNIGKGDFITGKSLEELLDDKNFAHIIWGAQNDDSVFGRKVYSFNKNERKTVVQTNKGVQYIEANLSEFKDRFYNTQLIDFDAYMSELQTRSSSLAKKESQFDVSYDSASNSITFTYTGDSSVPTETVYLTLTGEDLEHYIAAAYINFVNIPNLEQPRYVKNADGTDAYWDKAYIVINVPDDGDVHLGNRNNQRGNKYTSIAGADGVKVSISHDLDGKKNNDIGVTSMLYNFPNASQVVIPGSMQGTILAPKAHITDEKTLSANQDGDNPHISGALIGASFEGYTEVGYRPFTGPISIIGLSSDYTIYLSKYAEDGKTFLPGATLGLFEVDEAGNISEAPADTVLTEGTAATVNVAPGKYVIKEIAAPDGYAVDPDTEYYIEVTEEGKVEEKNIPTGEKETITNKIVYQKSELTDEELASGDYVPKNDRTTYSVNFSQIAFSDDNSQKDNVKISKFIFTYLDGTSAEATVTGIADNSDWWQSISISDSWSIKNDGIIKIEAVVDASETSGFKTALYEDNLRQQSFPDGGR